MRGVNRVLEPHLVLRVLGHFWLGAALDRPVWGNPRDLEIQSLGAIAMTFRGSLQDAFYLPAVGWLRVERKRPRVLSHLHLESGPKPVAAFPTSPHRACIIRPSMKVSRRAECTGAVSSDNLNSPASVPTWDLSPSIDPRMRGQGPRGSCTSVRLGLFSHGLSTVPPLSLQHAPRAGQLGRSMGSARRHESLISGSSLVFR